MIPQTVVTRTQAIPLSSGAWYNRRFTQLWDVVLGRVRIVFLARQLNTDIEHILYITDPVISARRSILCSSIFYLAYRDKKKKEKRGRQDHFRMRQPTCMHTSAVLSISSTATYTLDQAFTQGWMCTLISSGTPKTPEVCFRSSSGWTNSIW